ncbi:MAG: bifunctional nicotinamidase/pyrazinamidase [Chloroflexota bacterium]
MAEKIALTVVDLQNDFMPGGALAVPEGDHVVPIANRYVEMFKVEGLPIYATRDWHPPVTKHFRQYGGTWPSHCVQGTPGAEFHPELRLPTDTIVVSKGMDPEQDSYSAFDAFEADGTPMAESLRRRGVERLYIGGLATDYCVRWSVLSAMRLGFKITVLLDASLGVNLSPHDSERAIAEVVREGAEVTTIERVHLW